MHTLERYIESPAARAATIVGAALILSTLIGGLFYHAQQNVNVLSVTGSAKTSVTSDTAKLVISVQETIPQSQLKNGYAQMTSGVEAVRSYILKEGFDASSIDVTPVSTVESYDANNQFIADPRYQLNQTVELNSSDVGKVTDLSKSISALTGGPTVISVSSVEYYYSKLADLRVSLLGDAVKDAQARAEKIAQSSGRKIGTITAASGGVVQVLPLNSVDVSGDGSYDTSHIEKQVMVTVKANFAIR